MKLFKSFAVILMSGLITLSLSGCSKEENTKMSIEKQLFGTTEAGTQADIFTLKNKNGMGIRFWIKQHPGTSRMQLKAAYGSTWPRQFEFVGGDFSDCVEKSNLLISSASSTCMETLTRGIPVIIVGSRHSLTHNLIPETITDDIWRLCYSQQEIIESIKFYKSRIPQKIKEHEKAGRRIREEYFAPVTGEGVRMFLEVGSYEHETNSNI